MRRPIVQMARLSGKNWKYKELSFHSKILLVQYLPPTKALRCQWSAEQLLVVVKNVFSSTLHIEIMLKVWTK